MSVEAVIFDWGGTLTPWHDIDFGEEWASYARAWGGSPEQQEAMADRIVANVEVGTDPAKAAHALREALLSTRDGADVVLPRSRFFHDPAGALAP